MDTSIWIDLLAGKVKLSPDELLQFQTCGPVMQEVLQGMRTSPPSEAFADAFLALPRLSDPLPAGLFLMAADIYRRGREKGYTIRSGVDCLIAAIAIENKTPVWHKGRDFTGIARFTGLREWAPSR